MSETDFASLFADFRTAILTTVGEDGRLHARPMAMRQRVRGEEIWFATSIDSKKCRDLAADPRCSLVFPGDEERPTVSIAGRGEVFRDRRLARELWDPSWTTWFPGGPEQADVALVRVLPDVVERHGPRRPGGAAASAARGAAGGSARRARGRPARRRVRRRP